MALAVPRHVFTCGERTLLMGIVNVTPDSFSDGGRSCDPDDAVNHALQMVADGADILDVGGESTRPGADPVPADDEMRARGPRHRAAVAPRRPSIALSVDTRKPRSRGRPWRRAPRIVNDVIGRRRPRHVRRSSRSPAPASS